MGEYWRGTHVHGYDHGGEGVAGAPNDMDLYNLYVQFDMNNDAILELDEACYFAHAVVTIVWKTL